MGLRLSAVAAVAPEHRNREARHTAARSARGGRFRTWRRQRPFVGGLLMAIAGVELFFSGQLDLGNIQIQFGIEGLQATLIPLLLVLAGVLGALTPQHRVFYGILGLALAIYSLIGVNLGGFIVGMLIGTVGGVLMVAWMGDARPAPEDAA